jgi:hypothetical protein
MAVVIDHNSAQLRVTAHPKVETPEVLDFNVAVKDRGLKLVKETKHPGGACGKADVDEVAYFTCSYIEAAGSVRLLGGAGDRAAGWEVGFIQAQWCETNWGYYHGLSERDGSLLMQLGRPPARPTQGCLDMGDETVKGIWYSAGRANDIAVAGNKTLPLTLTAQFIDKPSDGYFVVAHNSKTGKDNYLAESRICLHFCTLFAARDPAGNYHQVQSFCWNVRYHTEFISTPIFNSGRHLTSVSVVPAGTGSYVSPILRGAVNDHRFRSYFKGRDSSSLTCNRLARTAEQNAQTVGRGRYESPFWRDFKEFR